MGPNPRRLDRILANEVKLRGLVEIENKNEINTMSVFSTKALLLASKFQLGLLTQILRRSLLL